MRYGGGDDRVHDRGGRRGGRLVGRLGRRQWARRDSGYTLVEVMMAVTITAIMATVVVVNLPTRVPDLRDEALAFTARARLAAQDSIVSGAVIGLKADEDGYAFFRFVAGEWREASEPPALTPRQWDTDAQVAVSIDNAPPLEDLSPEEIAALPPLIRFDPTGLATPFRLTLRDGRELYEVRVGQAGDIHVSEATGAPADAGGRR